MSNVSRGSARERVVADWLRDSGWVVTRTPASKQPFDLVALRAGEQPICVQVKASARSAFADFGPAERAALRDVAVRAGADAWLCWAPVRRPMQWLAPAEWPEVERPAA